MRFILLVEGSTERNVVPAFLHKWLDPKLSKAAGIHAVLLRGTRIVRDTHRQARLSLDDPRGDVIAVIALLDLYGVAVPFPPTVRSTKDRITWGREYLSKRVGQPRFYPHFAVHELEAWLLSDPKIFPPEVQKDLSKIKELPEAVNFQEPPSRLLERVYRLKTKQGYDKILHGTELFANLNPETAYDKCPNLKAMLDEMLRLAKEAGL